MSNFIIGRKISSYKNDEKKICLREEKRNETSYDEMKKNEKRIKKKQEKSKLNHSQFNT